MTSGSSGICCATFCPKQYVGEQELAPTGTFGEQSLYNVAFFELTVFKNQLS